MAENSKIEWTDHTFNPVVGCQKVSSACDNCYAEDWAKRYGQVEWGPHGERKRTSAANWKKPLAWDRKAAKEGRRAKVFCASLADVFDNRWPDGARDDLWKLIKATPNLDWLLLTKRPQNIAGMLPDGWLREPWPNVWLGTTVENQEEADRRIQHLLRIPARARFLSCEPLLGSLDLRQHLDTWWNQTLSKWWRGTPGRGIHLVIVGGESGPNARPMHPDWARSIRDQCVAAGVPFFFKQWGEWLPGLQFCYANVDDDIEQSRYRAVVWDVDEGSWQRINGDWTDSEQWWIARTGDDPAQSMYRVGKTQAGRLLDGREWNENFRPYLSWILSGGKSERTNTRRT